jgi:L-alanine-DL-glutamate epimerase-like enolase superfamily enzyme
MRISEILIRETTFPLKVPFITALRRVDQVQVLHVSIETEGGTRGLGAASPTAAITGETASSIREAVRLVGDSLKGKDTDDLNALLEQVSHSLPGNTSARAALDMALHDLVSRELNLPLTRFLGGGFREMVTDLTISLRDKELMVKDALDAERAGLGVLKIKLGREPEEDFFRFKAVSEAVSCRLRIDANQGWSVKDTLRFMDRCDRENLKVDLLEQPVRADDLQGMAFIRSRILCPLAADEAVFSPVDALRVIEAGSADIINIKLLKSGGIYQARKIAALAESAGLEGMIGCMMESPVGIAAAVHFAAATPGIRYFDLDVPLLLRDFSSDYGIVCEGPRMRPSKIPGLG